MFRRPAEAAAAYDVLIIGAGPAGIALARRLAEDARWHIAVVESGDLEPDPAIAALAQIDATGDLPPSHFPLHAQRIFGGTSRVWAGWCAVLEERSFRAGLWPITHAELLPWWRQACAVLAVTEQVVDRPLHAFAGTDLVYKPFYISPALRFGERFRAELAGHPRIDVFLRTSCLQLETAGARVGRVLLRDSVGGGEPWSLSARQTVLACGGLGNPRLLALSGLGGPVNGQGFMEHPHIYRAGRIRVAADLVRRLGTDQPVIHAWQLSDEACLREDLPGFCVSFRTDDQMRLPLLGGLRSQHEATAVVRAETPWLAGNNLRLGSARDGLDQPRAEMSFQFDLRRHLQRCWSLLGRALLAAGAGRLGELGPEAGQLVGGGHCIGTTRMGRDAATAVVDAELAVHGLDNAHVLGSSVFPAAGVANPTLTIVALALRLAARLQRRMAEEVQQ